MNEMINEVKRIITIKKSNIIRLSKGFDFPYAPQYSKYFSISMEYKSLESWEECLRLLQKYHSHREVACFESKSEYFKRVMIMEYTQYPGFITDKTKREMVEYMKVLEWKIERCGCADTENRELKSADLKEN